MLNMICCKCNAVKEPKVRLGFDPRVRIRSPITLIGQILERVARTGSRSDAVKIAPRGDGMARRLVGRDLTGVMLRIFLARGMAS
jgi:hypothetical protein